MLENVKAADTLIEVGDKVEIFYSLSLHMMGMTLGVDREVGDKVEIFYSLSSHDGNDFDR